MSFPLNTVHAYDVHNNSAELNLLYEEYLEKKSSGIEIIDLIDENGNLIGYYEPFTDEERDAFSKLRYSANINWTISAGYTTYGSNQYTLSAGSQITVNISQSRTGTSYLRFYNHSTNSFVRFTGTATTNGWSGKIVVLGSGVSTGVYSFGIENASSNSITYSGTYAL